MFLFDLFDLFCREEADELAKRLNTRFYRTSVKENMYVDEGEFGTLTKIIGRFCVTFHIGKKQMNNWKTLWLKLGCSVVWVWPLLYESISALTTYNLGVNVNLKMHVIFDQYVFAVSVLYICG